jgi:hypothetical protein
MDRKGISYKEIVGQENFYNKRWDISKYYDYRNYRNNLVQSGKVMMKEKVFIVGEMSLSKSERISLVC